MFIESLAVGGVDGTLHRRFGSMEGRVHAKTGFIANVSALSGYLQARDGNWYVFSILMDGIPDHSNSMIKPLQDRIVQAIDQQAGASR
jgi:D-alanyl-D-alanine carboxypeptidase/D-alanyl-D-alanine-endopeptidase (penicillin-binding protein 4)